MIAVALHKDSLSNAFHLFVYLSVCVYVCITSG